MRGLATSLTKVPRSL